MANAILAAELAERYRLIRELGGGGSATVYLATDLKHSREVAIKVLRPEVAASLAAERFLREIATVARLQHPHIVPLLDSGEAGGFLYFVMPYVAGDTLRSRLRLEGRLPIPDVIRILADVADAVAHAHERGVVHRDLKPENILLSGRHALVTDFGVARAASLAADQERQLTVGVALGTPAYMAPEQAMASPAIDHRVDVYALGVLGYELLAGRPPFTAGTPQDVLTMHVAVQPEPIESHRPDVPPDLARVIMRCLEKRPEERWPSATELVGVLEPLATPSGGITPTGMPPAGAPARGRWRAVAAIGAVSAVLVLLWPRGAEPGPPAGVTQQQLTFLGNVVDAAPSPDGAFLTYTMEDSLGQRIMVRDLLGGNVVSVAAAPSFEGVAWSPDGTELWYATLRPERGVFRVPRLGGTPRPMSAEVGVPAPDATRHAWASSARKALLIRGIGGADSTAIELPFDYLWPLRPAWSHDGSKVAVPLLDATGQRSSLAIVPTNGARPPHEIAVDSVAKLAAVWAPADRSLYYLGLRGNAASLFRVDLDGDGRARGAPVEILSGLEPGMVGYNGSARLAMSGDGRRLVYVRERASSNVGLLALGGDHRTALRLLTSGTAEHGAARLSPDDRQIAFFRSEPKGRVLQVIALDGGATAMEVALVGEGFEVAWAPNDDRLALTGTDRDLLRGIRVFRPGSADRREFLTGQAGVSLDWSPSGRIVYQRAGNQRFGLLDPVSGADSLLPRPDGNGWSFDPRVSPDGRWVAYRYSLGGYLGTMVAELGDTAVRMLASGDVRPLRWSPDGTRLWAARTALGDTREQLIEVAFPSGAVTPRQLFPEGIRLTDITRDGRMVVLTRRERQSDAWLIELP